MAHVAELPGCFAEGSSAPLAVASVPRAIVGFLAWLKAHREPLVPEAIVSRPTMSDLTVAEVRRAGAALNAGRGSATFDFDMVAWDDYKLERTLRWLGYSRADLLAKIEGMDETALKARHIAPGRTAWRTLEDVADVETEYADYITGAGGGVEIVTEPSLSDIRERLAAARELLLHRARAVPLERRAEIIYPIGTCKPNEPWTLAKALRRALEHELEHLREL